MSAPTVTPVVETALLRKVLGCFATGVTVVTSVRPGGAPLGFTANSFTSVSLSPPLVLVCVDRRSASLQAVRDSACFAVNILSEEQRDLSGRFASRAPDKFDGVAWSSGPTGSPLLDGALAWLDCRLHDVMTAGDHDIVIGEVVDLGQRPSRPLGYYRGAYFRVSLEQDVTDRRGRAVFGAIVEHRGRVLLCRPDAGSPWRFPEAAAQGVGKPLGGLLEHLDAAGAATVLSFLYSVAELPDVGSTAILYRGELLGEPRLADPDNWRFFAPDEVPWSALASYEVEMTLRRYLKEREDARFGLFADTGRAGRIAPIGDDLRPYTRDDAERTLRSEGP